MQLGCNGRSSVRRSLREGPYAFGEVDNLYGTDLSGERKSEEPVAETASHLH